MDAEKLDPNKFHSTFDAFIACCDTLQMRWAITYRYKMYNTSQVRSCTITIGSHKQVTARDGNNSLHLALLQAIEYMFETYAVFAKYNEQYKENKKKNRELEPVQFVFQKFTPEPQSTTDETNLGTGE